MSYDNLTKILAEKYPERFATWLLGTPQTNVEILKTELSIEPIRADSLTFLKTSIRHPNRTTYRRIARAGCQRSR
jgi:predicted transposase YdaD